MARPWLPAVSVCPPWRCSVLYILGISTIVLYALSVSILLFFIAPVAIFSSVIIAYGSD